MEIDVGERLLVEILSVNGECVLSGGLDNGVGVWRVEDGKQVAKMEADCLRPRDGSQRGQSLATCMCGMQRHREDYSRVYFSPNSSRLGHCNS